MNFKLIKIICQEAFNQNDAIKYEKNINILKEVPNKLFGFFFC